MEKDKKQGKNIFVVFGRPFFVGQKVDFMTLEERKRQRAAKIEQMEKDEKRERAEILERKNRPKRTYNKKEGVRHGRPRKSDLAEVVTDAGKPSIEELKNRIDDAIEEYKDTPPIIDRSKPLNAFIWAGICEYVGNRVFKGKELLQEPRTETQTNPNFHPTMDASRVYPIYDYYTYLTNKANAVPRACDFAKFIGITEETIQTSGSIATPLGRLFHEKIMQDKENGLESMLIGNRGNTTGVAMVLNVRHGWTQSREVVHTDQTTRIAARDLPKLGTSGE